jgi:DNA-binding response OmpR family regulator
MRVLVVEDHAVLAGRIAQGLRQAGMAVDAVHDGAAALEAASGVDDLIETVVGNGYRM